MTITLVTVKPGDIIRIETSHDTITITVEEVVKLIVAESMTKRLTKLRSDRIQKEQED